ncbi:Asp-tRNA(Asn)/Glu-tRNA(Gln) amidotransferase subunit GatC [Candidatus Saccharibacteria bacterium]|nr:Asp-tRNA(Asn)/Glu-tRNA(Gln) amidotransferase subunit GatC [Candidatus Saccharibacteria bacterium]
MSRLSRDDVLKLARLSRLKLSDDEVERFQSELSNILDYVETLQSVETDNLEPTSQVTGLTNVMRKDELIDYQASTDALLENAPEIQDHQIKVKRILG